MSTKTNTKSAMKLAPNRLPVAARAGQNADTRDPKTLLSHPKQVEIYGELESLDHLKESMKDVGLLQPIQITKQGVILSGHQRRDAAVALGWSEVTVEVVDCTDPTEQLKRLLIANQTRSKTNLQKAREAKCFGTILRAEAKERQREAGKISGKSQARVSDAGQTREKLANLMDCSPRTAERYEAIGLALEAMDNAGLTHRIAEVKALLEKSITDAFEHEAVQANQVQRKLAKANRPKPSSGKGKQYDRWALSFDVRLFFLLAWALLGKYLYPPHDPRPAFNNQLNDSIGWAPWSWNPLTGCLMACVFCYAAKLAQWIYPMRFAPTFHPARLWAPANTKIPKHLRGDPAMRRVFVCSMADLFGKWVPARLIERIIEVERTYTTWEYIHLTKFPKRMATLKLRWPKGAWVGVTVTGLTPGDLARAVAALQMEKARCPWIKTWLSVEPLLDRLPIVDLTGVDYVIVGGASENTYTGTPKFVPPIAWVNDIIGMASKADCKLWFKDNLEYQPRQLPGVPQPTGPAPKAFSDKHNHGNTEGLRLSAKTRDEFRDRMAEELTALAPYPQRRLP